MEPIRVLHVFGGLDAGGAESRTMDIYRHLNRDNVQFDFLVHTNKKGFFEDEITNLGGRIYRVPRFSPKTIFTYPKAIKETFETHPEYKIIHGHMLSTAFIYLRIAKAKGIPVRIAHSRAGSRAQKDLISKIKNMTDKLSRIYATHKFAVSKIAGYNAFGVRQVDSKDVKVIPNAIKAKDFIYNDSVRNNMRNKFAIDDDLVIGHIGRFSPQKNHFFILDIFIEIQKKMENSKLILVGEGQLKIKVQKKVKELGLENKVILLGARNDVKDILQAADVLLFPSTHEGLPGVVLEAQAASLPCVISEDITEEVNITDIVSYMALDESVEHWAEKTIDIATNTKRNDMYNQIINSGFDIEEVAKWYEKFYLHTLKD